MRGFGVLMDSMLKAMFAATLCLTLTACESPISDVKEGANSGKTPANNAAPVISPIADASTFLNAVKTIPFQITDADSTLDCQRSVTITTSNQSLLPATYVTLAGSAPNCTMSLRPAGGVSGTATVTVVAYDGVHRTSLTFNLQVFPPALTASAASANEGGSLTFTVQLSQPASTTVTVAYSTADGTGVAGTNYTAASGTLAFSPGQTSKSVTVATLDDGVYAPAKTMSIGFTAFGSTVNATGTIQNTDPAIPVASAISPAAFDEDVQSGLITLSYSVPDGSLATACTISSLSHVTVTQACSCDVAGVCTLKVTGASYYHGSAGFNYTVHANGVDSNSAAASLTVNSVSNAPVASDFSPAAFDADTESGLITLNYASVGGDLGTSCAISSPSHVSVTQACACDGSGVCTAKVTGATHYSGAASFGFTVSSGSAVSNAATASLTVNLVKSYGLSFTGGTTLDSSVTYARSGGASRVNASGQIESVDAGVSRIEYDPNTLTLNGLLLEESRTNLLRLGTALDSVYWFKSGSSVAGAATSSPDGTTSAGKITEDGSSGAHEIRVGSLPKAASSSPYTFSVFAKAGERTSVHLYIYGASFGDSAGTICSLSGSGSVSSASTSGSFTSAYARAEAWPNGWYRCVITGTTSADNSVGAAVGLVSSGSTTYAGDGASGAYLWGTQLEAGAGATSLIPDKNLLTNSEQLDQAPWMASASSVGADATTDPSGGTTADMLSDDSSLNFHYAYQVINTAPSKAFTYSFYAKAGSSGQVMAQINDDASSSDNVNAKFDLTNGLVTSTSNSGNGSSATSSITAAGNGWYRCSVSGYASNAGTQLDVRAYILNSSGNNYYSGGSGNLYLWGQQLESGSSITSYWPVGASGPTRGADLASVGTLGSWFEASSGTVVTSSRLAAAATVGVKKYVAAFTDGTPANVAAQYFTPTGAAEHLVVSSSAQTDAPVSFTASGVNKVATAYQLNDLQTYANGTGGTAVSTASIPTVTSLQLGSDGSANFLNGWLRSLDYYPSRAPNASMGTLTQ